MRDWSIDIIVREPITVIAEEDIRPFILACLKELESEINSPLVTEISIVLTDDAEIQTLNREYRGKDKPTDVLSFSQQEGEIGVPSPSLGDIIISIETATQQAVEYKTTLQQELYRLLAHGTLHLLGYDHENVPQEEAERMFARQDALIAEVGFVENSS